MQASHNYTDNLKERERNREGVDGGKEGGSVGSRGWTNVDFKVGSRYSGWARDQGEGRLGTKG